MTIKKLFFKWSFFLFVGNCNSNKIRFSWTSYYKNKRKKFYTTFRWLHAIIFKWKENKIDYIIYTVQGDKT